MRSEIRKASDMMSETFRFIQKSSGRVFRARRKLVGLTQAQVAKIAGVRPETVYRLESGRDTNPTVKTLERMLRAVER
jgi:transcriptional regulator with XRE-family HTH domain